MATPLAGKQTGWRVAASGLFLVALLAAPIAIVATMASPQPKDEFVAAGETAAAMGIPVENSALTDPGNIGHFAFGYVEFDVDPRRPGGVPGFDSWPPGSPHR
jgi:hypothetical protein